MSRFIEGQSRTQSTLFPEVLDDYIHEDNPIRAVDMFINSLDLSDLGFARCQPAKTGILASKSLKRLILRPRQREKEKEGAFFS